MEIERKFTYCRNYVRSLIGNIDILENLIMSSRFENFSFAGTMPLSIDKCLKDFLCAIFKANPLLPVKNLLNDCMRSKNNCPENPRDIQPVKITSIYNFFIKTLISLIPFYSTDFKVKSQLIAELESIQGEIEKLVNDTFAAEK